jgi:hypothetical protein
MSVSVSGNTNIVTVTQPTTQVVRVVTAGPQGPPGPQGIQGPAGSQEGGGGVGTQGIQGTTGLQGVQGLQGTQGLQGIQGRQGLQGIQGTTGAQGAIGSQGSTGIQGSTGQGIQGTIGETGIQGIQGTAGESIQGAIGEIGIQGTVGETGIQGPIGIQGIAGEAGIQGITGLQGAEGIQGPQGIQGVGIQGPQGPAGDVTGIDTGSFATTGSNTFTDNQVIQGSVTASFYFGNGRYLTSLPGTTNWNYNQEFEVKKTEQLTFSGDYILENTYLFVEGGTPGTIGEWTFDDFNTNSTATPVGRRRYLINGPSEENNSSTGCILKRFFDTETTMSVDYIWNCEESNSDWPYYDISEQDLLEPNNQNRLVNEGSRQESGTWTLNIPANSWVGFGVWTPGNNLLSGSLEITLPYLPNEDLVQYSTDKYFTKEGTIYIGGNLLVKDSYIENDGKISVGGEVILIGNSQITGTGIII